MTRRTTPHGPSDGRIGPGRRAAPGIGADEVLRWAASLPWVVRLPERDRSEPIRFAVDCPILERSGVWLLFDTSEDFGLPRSLMIVLPGDVARRGAVAGWAVPITDLDDGRWVVAVATPKRATEFRALQRLLMLSYISLFSHAEPG